MNFLYPSFLWASTAILIPIAIHFFNLRSYKTVYFSNTAFLQKVKEQSKTRNQLKHLLVLLFRILAILSLVVVFAQPQTNQTQQPKAQQADQVAIYLDNSFSMEALSDKGMLLDAAKNKIHSIVSAHGLNTAFTLSTNDAEIRHREFVSANQLLKQIGEVEVSAAFLPFSKIIPTLKERFNANTKQTIYLVSDFQKTNADFEQFQPDSNLTLRLLPLNTQQQGNLYIDSVWFEQPSHIINHDEELFVRLVNLSDQSFENLPITFKTNGTNRSVINTNLTPNQTKEVSLKFANKTKGYQLAQVEISDYPITFDNTYQFSYQVVDQISIMLINEQDSNRYFSALNDAVSLLNIQQVPVTNVPVSQLLTNDLVILNSVEKLSTGLQDILIKYVTEGGNLFLFPKLDATELNSNFLAKLAGVNLAGTDTTRSDLDPKVLSSPFYAESIQPIHDNVLLPSFGTKLIYTTARPTNWTPLLWDRTQNPLLQQTPVGRGTVYLASFELTQQTTNFMTHPLFAATLLAAPIKSVRKEELAYKIGNTKNIEIKIALNNSDELLKIKSHSTDFSFIPPWHINPITQQVQLQEINQIKKAGHYQLMQANQQLAVLSFNYDRRESDWHTWQKDELKTWAADKNFAEFTIFEAKNSSILTDQLQDIHKSASLWRIFLILGLLFILGEVLVIRFWR